MANAAYQLWGQAEPISWEELVGDVALGPPNGPTWLGSQQKQVAVVSSVSPPLPIASAPTPVAAAAGVTPSTPAGVASYGFGSGPAAAGLPTDPYGQAVSLGGGFAIFGGATADYMGTERASQPMPFDPMPFGSVIGTPWFADHSVTRGKLHPTLQTWKRRRPVSAGQWAYLTPWTRGDRVWIGDKKTTTPTGMGGTILVCQNEGVSTQDRADIRLLDQPTPPSTPSGSARLLLEQKEQGGLNYGTGRLLGIWNGDGAIRFQRFVDDPATASTAVDIFKVLYDASVTFFGAPRIQGSTTTSYFELVDGQVAAVSATNEGRERYNNATARFQLSMNGGAWTDIITTATLNHNLLSATHPDTLADSPVLGDLVIGNATPKWARLAGQITTTRKFLRQTGTGAVSALPVWDTILAADVPASALTKVDDTNVTLTLGGSPSVALLAAASLTLGWTGTLAVARGGTNSGTALNSNRIIVSSAGAIVEAAALTNGQLLIGSTGAAPVAATLTAGANITITNGAGSITIAASGGGAPGGADTNVQFNDAGAFGGSSAFIFNKTNNNLGIGTAVTLAANETLTVLGTKTVASAAGALWNSIHFAASTLTLTGAVNVTTGTGVNLVTIERPTLTYDAAPNKTVTNAATLYIANSPLAGVNAIITNAYAFWVDAGIVRIDGDGATIFQTDSANNRVAIGTVPTSSEHVRIGTPFVSGGALTALTITHNSLNNQTASTEVLSLDVAPGTIQHATGALATQRAFLIRPPTYSFVAASTIATAATLAILNAPTAGPNTTITTPLAFWVQTGTTRLDGLLRLTAQAAPGSPTLGDLWQDSTQQTLIGFMGSSTVNGIKSYAPWGYFTATASVSINNTAAETSLLGTGTGTKTLPANFFVVGKVVEGWVTGHYTTGATPQNITIKIKLGTTIVAASPSMGMIPNETNMGFKIQYKLTCRTTGATGTIMAWAEVIFDDVNAGGLRIDYALPSTPGTPATVDTTVSQALDITLTTALADAGATYVSTQADIRSQL